MFNQGRAGLLALTLALSAGSAEAAPPKPKMPSGVDFQRMKLLEQGKSTLMKVYVNMVAIGDGTDAHLLIPRRAGESVGSKAQLNRRFMDAIKTTQRFEVYDDSQVGMRDQADIVVDGMVVSATQDIEDFTAIRKSVTTVRLSVQIKDSSTGKLLAAKTVSGIYGSEPKEGTIIRSESELSRSDVQEKLKNDFERALQEALENAAAFIEYTYRPIGKVVQVDGSTIAFVGGTEHGFRPGDKVVVFRGQFTKDGPRFVPGIMRPLAIAGCDTVNPETSQCDLEVAGEIVEIKPGDFAIPLEASLKLGGIAAAR